MSIMIRDTHMDSIDCTAISALLGHRVAVFLGIFGICIPSSDNYKEYKDFQAMLFLSLSNCLQGPYWKLKLIPDQRYPDCSA